MSAKILQVNYKLNGPRAEYEKENLPYAQPIADIPGLRWKVWIINEAQSAPPRAPRRRQAWHTLDTRCNIAAVAIDRDRGTHVDHTWPGEVVFLEVTRE